ncbi:MAG: hypothetical protein B7733_00615 [Myxococcales bacterium FL481]|nr:MAG: hypothetical protein B7733_00615 [Myxococcales bacterium FL481]
MSTSSDLPSRTHRGTPIILMLILVALSVPAISYLVLGKATRMTPEERAAARAGEAARRQAASE